MHFEIVTLRINLTSYTPFDMRRQIIFISPLSLFNCVNLHFFLEFILNIKTAFKISDYVRKHFFNSTFDICFDIFPCNITQVQ